MAWYNPFSWPVFAGDDSYGTSVPAENVLATDVYKGWEPGFIPLEFIKPFRKYGLCDVQDIRTAFRLCSPLQAIVTQKATAFTKGKIVVWNPATEKPVRGQFKEWDTLFRQPNPYQSGRRFFIQAYSYVQQYGYCVIDPLYPTGFADRPSELYVIPNWAIEWERNLKPSRWRTLMPQKAWQIVGGQRVELDVKKLIIIRDPACTDYDEETGLPVSRASCLEQEVSNLIAALQARGEMITDRGANGIISNTGRDSIGHTPMDPEEKDRVQRAYKRYGMMKGQDKIIITDAALNYTPMTFDTTQLGLQPEHIAAVKGLCNVYGFPFTALAEGYEGKYNNSSNARRDFQDTTIDPESMDFFEQLSLGLKMYDQRCEAYMDFSGVASVQASQEEKGKGEQAMASALQTQWDLGIVTRNDVREKLGYERETENPDEFDKYKFETASAIETQEMANNENKEDGSTTD